MNEFMNNVQIDWGLSSTKVSGGAIVSVGTTSITADDFSASFNGDTVTYTVPKSGRGSRSSSRKSQTVRFTEGLVNPERLGNFHGEGLHWVACVRCPHLRQPINAEGSGWRARSGHRWGR